MAEVMKNMEQAGEEGRVQEAEDMTLQVEKLKLDLEKAKEEANPYLRQEKNMEICEICGAFLVMNDTQRRLEAHFEGRQHVGFLKVREKCAELKLKYKDHQRNQRFSDNREYRPRSRSPARSTSSYRSRDSGDRRGSNNSEGRDYRPRSRTPPRSGSSYRSRDNGRYRDRKY